jgi:threonine dehydratase
LKITLEAFGTEHKQQIIKALADHGYTVRQVNVNI